MPHPTLLASLSRLEAHFQADPRCVALYLWGSMGKGTADLYSDVDVALVVEDAGYAAVKEELRAVCEQLCGPIRVWLPEGNTPHTCNYAFLFKADEHLLLYDFYISDLSSAHAGPGSAPKKVLFDRHGLFTGDADVTKPAPRAVQSLEQMIDIYWVYLYLNGKYFCRSDVYKMLYVQNVLFHTHLKVLQTLAGDNETSWWARDIQRLPEAKQQEMLVYFGAADCSALAAALWREMDLFAEDARAACRQSGIAYPQPLEESVRQHLKQMGVFPSNREEV